MILPDSCLMFNLDFLDSNLTFSKIIIPPFFWLPFFFAIPWNLFLEFSPKILFDFVSLEYWKKYSPPGNISYYLYTLLKFFLSRTCTLSPSGSFFHHLQPPGFLFQSFKVLACFWHIHIVPQTLWNMFEHEKTPGRSFSHEQNPPGSFLALIHSIFYLFLAEFSHT